MCAWCLSLSMCACLCVSACAFVCVCLCIYVCFCMCVCMCREVCACTWCVDQLGVFGSFPIQILSQLYFLTAKYLF